MSRPPGQGQPPPPRYRRVVLDLPPREADRQVLQAAAELARLLDAELHAVFVEDPALAALADFPFARELRLPTHDWRPVTGTTLAEDLRHAIGKAARDIAALRTAMGLRGETLTRQGDAASLVATMCVATDIVVRAPPARAAERALGEYRRRGLAASRRAASLLLLPPATPTAHGPVAVAVTAATDDALAVAALLAARAGAELLVLAPVATLADAVSRATALAGPSVRVRGQVLGVPATGLALALHAAVARLCVLTRGAVMPDGDDAIAALADESRVAVLALEPPAG